MARPKGDGRGRLGGRKKGTPNKSTSEMRESISCFVSQKFEDFCETWGKIKDPERKCSVYINLLKYSLPQLSSVDIGIDDDNGQKAADYICSLRDRLEKEGR